MNTKQLAEFLNVSERTIQRWVKKASDRMSSINDKMSSASPMFPANFDIEEVTWIIETGLGKNAALIFKQNALSNENNLYKNVEVKDLNNEFDMMRMMIDQLEKIKYDVNEQKQRIINIEKNQKETQMQIGYNGYMKLKAYCSKNKIHKNHGEMLSIARTLRVIADENEMEIKKVQDDTYGEVNSYPMELLDMYFLGYKK